MSNIHPISSLQVLGKKRKSSQMFEFRQFSLANLYIFFYISFAAIVILIIFADSFIYKLSLDSVAKTKTNPQELLPCNTLSTHEPLFSVEEEAHDHEAYSEDYSHLVRPINVTDKVRIAWFKKNLLEFKIFKSTKLTRKFDSRVQKFFGSSECNIRFFMTWISPARSFGRREFLAMESLFKAHPHGCLVIVSRTMDSLHGHMILKPLLDCKFKILAVKPDLPLLFKNTPAESWFRDIKRGNKDPGEIPLAQNLSNLIRLVILYKYGGVYLDTDFIVLKDFSSLRNSIGAQSIDVSGNWTRLNNALLVFDKDHPLLYEFIKEFAFTFDGNRWGHNGPYLVSRVVERVATRPEFKFTVLPPTAFYPVDWTRIAAFFLQPNDRATSKWVEAKLLQLSGETYGVHLWNRQSSSLRIEERSIMDRLIKEHCVSCIHISCKKPFSLKA